MRKILILLALSAILPACEKDDEGCSGAVAEPFPAALGFGDLKAGAPEGPLGEAAPARRAVLVRNGCSGTLTVTASCVVGDARGAYVLEGPDRDTAGPGDEIAWRVTYAPTEPEEPIDGQRPPDGAALVILSNAKDAPVLVVPLCGRLIADDETAGETTCALPDLSDSPCGG